MRLCGPGIWGWPADRENALRVLRRALELGLKFIDTADSYGPHVNEEQIAQALHPYPSGLVIATKGGLTRGGPGEWKRDCRPEHLQEACEGSLRRLRVDRIESISCTRSIRRSRSKIRSERCASCAMQEKFGTSAFQMWTWTN